MFRRFFVIGALLGALAAIFAATAAAAAPHIESATASMNAPTVTSPGTIAWDATLQVPFQIAGLGNAKAATVSLSATGGVSVTNTTAGNLAINQQGGSGSSISISNSHLTSVALSQLITTATFTADKNGTAFGTLTIPTEIDLSSITSACIQASWTNITLTLGGNTLHLPNLSQTYDPTGTACPA